MIGTLAVVAAFVVLLYAGIRIAMGARDPYGRLIAGALTGMLVVPGGSEHGGRHRGDAGHRQAAAVRELRRLVDVRHDDLRRADTVSVEVRGVRAARGAQPAEERGARTCERG